jgi:hypothetical protein
MVFSARFSPALWDASRYSSSSDARILSPSLIAFVYLRLNPACYAHKSTTSAVEATGLWLSNAPSKRQTWPPHPRVHMVGNRQQVAATVEIRRPTERDARGALVARHFECDTFFFGLFFVGWRVLRPKAAYQLGQPIGRPAPIV